ncbi:MAG: hypothetical protein KIS67_19300 [Verrucomicrobiae bacterium]|nr:hypothetical protein [Verrucomicrobiae bacterium]
MTATNNAVTVATRVRSFPRLNLPGIMHATVITNPASTKMSLFLANLSADDFTVLVRNPEGYRATENAQVACEIANLIRCFAPQLGAV